MKRSKTTILTLFLAAAIFSFGVFFSVYLSSLEYTNAPSITLPKKTQQNIVIDGNIRLENQRTVDIITVDAGNAKEVLAHLFRPQNYTFTSTTTVFSANSSMQVQIVGYVSGDMAKIIRYEGGAPVANVVLTQTNAYWWQQGSSVVLTVSRGDFSTDDFAGLPTYEVLLNVEIAEAELIQDSDELSIMVMTKNELSGLWETYVISLGTGLLKTSTFMDYEQLVTHTSVMAVSTEPFSEDIFKLPSGQPID